MLLNDLSASRMHKFQKNKKMLESVYGVKIEKTDSLAQARRLEESSRALAQALQEKRRGINDKSVQKYAMISESYKMIADEINNQRLAELDKNYRISESYNRTIERVANFVVECMENGEDLQVVFEAAVDEYRNSKHKYPDTEFEQDLRAFIMSI